MIFRRLKLRSILLNHVALGAVGITHLINLDSIRTLDNYRVNISVSNLGQVRLENQSSITQANIVVRTGFIHRVDKLIVPSYMDVVYPNSCPEIQSRDVQGRCMPCDLRKCPRPTDIMTTRYSRRCVRSMFSYTPYCKAVCRRETKIRQCCPGFYGRACLPCPSGFRSPCSGRGQCDAGILGSGRCKCEAGYAGSACQMCRETDKYGPTCTANRAEPELSSAYHIEQSLNSLLLSYRAEPDLSFVYEI
ncbi:hypothetical protein RRG08_056319 [Elysia crispata]|uniref:EGF-like domain-containing protein n=1 Tax=Elysia crispata TaxID=231223 RepID=A0AAE0YP99_9GAST|nr:hypothetical protein RRG08_056319 [Elysia crispata]